MDPQIGSCAAASRAKGYGDAYLKDESSADPGGEPPEGSQARRKQNEKRKPAESRRLASWLARLIILGVLAAVCGRSLNDRHRGDLEQTLGAGVPDGPLEAADRGDAAASPVQLSVKDLGRPPTFDGTEEAWAEWSFATKAFWVVTGLIEPADLEALSHRERQALCWMCWATSDVCKVERCSMPW